MTAHAEIPETAAGEARSATAWRRRPEMGVGDSGTDSAQVAVRALLLTDLVDSTKLVEKLGDARAFEVATRHDRVSRDLLPRFDGLEIDKTDGFLLLFERPLDAVGYALAYHQALAELSVELGVQLRARAGIHLGEVFLRENDPDDVARGAKPLEVEGLAKPVAARVMSLAGGKQTLMTEGAFNLARQAAAGTEPAGRELVWLAHGPYLFKGVEEPVDVYEVGIPGVSLLEVPPDSAKVRRAVTAGDEVTLGWRPGAGLEIPRRSGWVLERRLGEGGFGEVWLAVHRSTAEPRVFKFCYEAERLRTFKREVTLFRLLRESLGHRPDIVRILDWSFDEAPYFLEVEHVEGGDLVDWAEEQGGLAEVPLADRLEIVAQVADALAAAHSVGVLHKDVKPRNVLIAADGDGQVRAKLADFGVSEVDESALVARGITVMGMTELVTPDSGTSSVAGSHLYMAPEVAEGRPATVQADLYALGVMLYQVVAGDFRRALGSGWRRDVDDDLLAEDVAAFVDREAERRPASAREVAERLRTLEERRAKLTAERRAREEAEASRRTLERAQRRRKVFGVIAAAATVVLAIVSVLAVRESRSRAVAETRREQAEDLIGFMLGDLRKKLEPVGRLPILDDVGEKAMEYFAAVPEEELSDEELARRSMALYQIGDVRIAQGKLAAAQAPLEESLALAQVLVEREPDNNERLFGLGQSQFWVGYVRWKQEDLDSALGPMRAYLETSETLVARDPENLDWRLELAYAHSNLGSILEAQGDLAGALERFRRTLAIKQELVGRDPTNLDWQLDLAETHNMVGIVLQSQGQLPAARRHFETEIEIKRSLVETDPENAWWRVRLGLGHNYLGKLLAAMGELPEARETNQMATEILQRLVTDDPTNTDWQHHLIAARLELGQTLRELGDLEGAWAQTVIVETSNVRLLRQDPGSAALQRKVARAEILSSKILKDRADLGPALARARNAVSVLETLVERNPKDSESLRLLGESLVLLGAVESRRGRLAQAEESWARASELLEPVLEGARCFECLASQIKALLYSCRVAEARPYVEKFVQRVHPDTEMLNLLRNSGLRGSKINPDTQEGD